MDRETLDKILAAHAGHKWGRHVPLLYVLLAMQIAFDLWSVLHHG